MQAQEITLFASPIYVGRRDVATALGLSLRQVDYAIGRGCIAAQKLGNRTLIPLDCTVSLSIKSGEREARA
jgi:hypothetical protein